MEGRSYSSIAKVLVFIIDCWLIHFAFSIVREQGMHMGMPELQFTTFYLVFSLIWIASGFLNKIYRLDSISMVQIISVNLFNAFLTHILLTTVLLYSVNVFSVHLKTLIWLYSLSIIFIAATRVAYKIVRKYLEFSGFERRDVVVVGITGSGKALHEFFEKNPSNGYRFKGFFSNEIVPGYKNLTVGGLDDIKEYCTKEGIDEIYFALPLTHQHLLKELSRFSDDQLIHFRIAPDFSSFVNKRGSTFLVNSVPVLTTRREPLGLLANSYIKRTFDLVFSLAVICIVFPFIFPLIALAIRLDSSGPILFKQLRPGKRNKLFECYKFRTMYINKDTELQASKDDRRITKVGKFLRKTNMDELPQFFNVLFGNMSVVGPRPNLVSHLEEYSKKISDYKIRHFITPGITGYAQIHGLRGETREPGLMEKRVQYDVNYLENWTLVLDLKIIMLTVWNMVKGDKNAY
ncbi:MAG TPA: undecaprenyl-phosphate glucose phosphotransferase [Cyclobacteriaceae bacterium]|nr:undecaprenyl-phosphate glucose phosphotransferase [Cyclobacteriaceae bacterium]